MTERKGCRGWAPGETAGKRELCCCPKVGHIQQRGSGWLLVSEIDERLPCVRGQFLVICKIRRS